MPHDNDSETTDVLACRTCDGEHLFFATGHQFRAKGHCQPRTQRPAPGKTTSGKEYQPLPAPSAGPAPVAPGTSASPHVCSLRPGAERVQNALGECGKSSQTERFEESQLKRTSPCYFTRASRSASPLRRSELGQKVSVVRLTLTPLLLSMTIIFYLAYIIRT